MEEVHAMAATSFFPLIGQDSTSTSQSSSSFSHGSRYPSEVEPEEAERSKIMAGHRRNGGAIEELPQDARLACRVPVEA